MGATIACDGVKNVVNICEPQDERDRGSWSGLTLGTYWT